MSATLSWKGKMEGKLCEAEKALIGAVEQDDEQDLSPCLGAHPGECADADARGSPEAPGQDQGSHDGEDGEDATQPPVSGRDLMILVPAKHLDWKIAKLKAARNVSKSALIRALWWYLNDDEDCMNGFEGFLWRMHGHGTKPPNVPWRVLAWCVDTL